VAGVGAWDDDWGPASSFFFIGHSQGSLGGWASARVCPHSTIWGGFGSHLGGGPKLQWSHSAHCTRPRTGPPRARAPEMPSQCPCPNIFQLQGVGGLHTFNSKRCFVWCRVLVLTMTTGHHLEVQHLHLDVGWVKIGSKHPHTCPLCSPTLKNIPH
jgi:hypothetical protein